ncbi:stage II sporulation protein M [Mesoterricola sediminis]|uniref:Membrane protein n=1 Tax=Mesoterricola sediminis TaxID=2927980 RepID=A0AA48GTE8_9BACT|nr:stage II sporulation protein M [Mesoterricola sediminis]BDU77262.1 membrane protein [Mesoterricola sediminis]
MKQEAFERQHGEAWARFEALCGGASGDLPTAYRRVCLHLALARQRGYTERLVLHLNGLVRQGHQALYGPAGNPARSWGAFLAGGFARAVRRLRVPVLASALLFGVPFASLALGAARRPEAAQVILEPQELSRMEGMYEGQGGRFGRSGEADTDVGMFGFYVWNNVRVGFQAFAGGLLMGVGALFFLVHNGLHGGAAAGWVTHAGLGRNFWSFVVTHSALELPSLILSGAAGLAVGWALWAPGRRTRGEALRAAVVQAMPLVIGAALMDVAAAALEAFWSSSAAVPPAVKFTTGGVLWALMLVYFLAAGRTRAR